MEHNYLIPVIPLEGKTIAYGRGSYVYDKDGKQYLDLNSGQFCTILGHSNKAILKEIFSRAEKIVHTASNIITDEVAVCAEELHRISGEMKAYTILLNTGSEAVEFALRFAKYIKKREGVVCFDKGYHGLTLGAQSVTFSGKFARPYVESIASIEIPDKGKIDHSLEKLKAYLQTGRYACVLFEPVVSVGGMRYPEPEFFKEARRLCDEYEAILAFDESQTGFGRTGEWFAYQKLGVIPDMAVLAKGLGLGFPVAAVLFRDTLIPEAGKYGMTHYSSHQNDAFSAAIVNSGIHYIENNKLLKRVRIMGEYFLERLKMLEEKNGHIKDARGCGLMLGAELCYEGIENYRDVYHNVYGKMAEKGVLIQGTDGGHTLRFLPDYLIQKEDIDFAVENLDEAL